ncbi:Putative peptidoglycan binding domain protein [Candidatus Burarchaeum australiense]|nr:Putative peptidoglycan binding domain protein [Candidatus Burarchaeum australiense]
MYDQYIGMNPTLARIVVVDVFENGQLQDRFLGFKLGNRIYDFRTDQATGRERGWVTEADLNPAGGRQVYAWSFEKDRRLEGLGSEFLNADLRQMGGQTLVQYAIHGRLGQAGSTNANLGSVPVRQEGTGTAARHMPTSGAPSSDRMFTRMSDHTLAIGEASHAVVRGELKIPESTLRLGSAQVQDVKDLQTLLNSLGISDASGHRLEVTGVFDQQTKEAVTAWQKYINDAYHREGEGKLLLEDGVFGQHTRHFTRVIMGLDREEGYGFGGGRTIAPEPRDVEGVGSRGPGEVEKLEEAPGQATAGDEQPAPETSAPGASAQQPEEPVQQQARKVSWPIMGAGGQLPIEPIEKFRSGQLLSLPAVEGTSVIAPVDGTVTDISIGIFSGYVRIRGDDCREYFIGHLSPVSIRTVSVNGHVTGGRTVLGQVGGPDIVHGYARIEFKITKNGAALDPSRVVGSEY